MVSPEDYDPSTDFFVLDEATAERQASEIAAQVLADPKGAQEAIARLTVEVSPHYMQVIVDRVMHRVALFAAFRTSGNVMAKHVMGNLTQLVVAANAIASRYGVLQVAEDDVEIDAPVQ
jgi:hypothetical protein